MPYVIGCDLGSQSLKGVLLDGDGNAVAAGSSSYDMVFPRPGWAEQDPRVWWTALKEVISQLLLASRVHPADIRVIGFASQVDGVVPVNQAGQPLRNAIIWMDRRSEAQCQVLEKAAPREDIFRLTGLNLDSSHVAPKLLWIREHEPDVFRTARYFLLPGSYLVHRMTGTCVVDYSNASCTLIYDICNKIWSSFMLEYTGIDARTLGAITPADQIAGHLTTEAARELGLLPSTKVIVGCGDEHGACLGAGLVKPGIVCDIVGTAEPVAVAAQRLLYDSLRLVETHAHADPRWWLLENPGFVSGGSVRWFADKFAHGSYHEVNASARRVDPGSEGVIFLPCLSGAMTPKWNGAAKGTFYGLTMKHGMDHMARAVLEGCCFGFRDIMERFGELGIARDDVRLVGGGANSQLWCQIKADVTGRSIRTLAHKEATARGAAMLAGVAAGTFPSLDDAANRLVSFQDIYEPNLAHRAAYDEAYGLYRELYSSLEPVFSLNEARKGHDADR